MLIKIKILKLQNMLFLNLKFAGLQKLTEKEIHHFFKMYEITFHREW